MFFRCSSGTQKTALRGMKPCWRQCLKQTKTTRHTWRIACDANMNSEDFERCRWFQVERMQAEARKQRPRVDQEMLEESGLRRPMTTSLRAAASGERFPK